MESYNQNLKELIKDLNSDVNYGLTEEKVIVSREKNGENKLVEKKKKNFFQKLIEQFKDIMIIILIIAAIISFVLACLGSDPMEFIEPALIIFIVFVNAFIGVIQENRAEKALDALKNMSSPHARVLRDGQEKIINTSLLVPGDIIYLEAGDYVPADCRLIESVNLKAEESSLTGESLACEKDAKAVIKNKVGVGDRTNMVFSGCSITYGTSKGIVTSTGMNTEIGKIANLLNNEKEIKTPLQQKLAELGKYLGIIALLACIIVFIVGLIDKQSPLEMFMTSVSLAVSAIPEGLPAVVTIVLSLGVARMAKQNAIIKSLPAVETLGSASIICSDKTGTLTQNKMTIVKSYVDDQELIDFNKDVDDKTKKLIMFGELCSNGNVNFNEGKEVHLGDPTETSIIVAGHKLGFDKTSLNNTYPRINELPFDSDRKLMSTINLIDGKNYLIVKGAFDVMASRCIKGNILKAKKINEEMSLDALRVLAVGYKELDSLPENIDISIENDLIFMGLIGMIDPPREEAKDAVYTCLKAGIKPIMITGDHVITATSIAKKLGIYKEGDLAITGTELDKMSEEELNQKVERISVYARVSPENKIRIVKAWQNKGEVVAMTGDGVNDAPALKASDIGCSMGITGTDVAKGASDIILSDDNFATIVEAVKEGRGIYSNIKKVVGFLLSTNIAELIVVFLAMIIWKESPFISIQLLWINLVTDSLPAISLGVEKVDDDIMDYSPKPKNESLFSHGFGLRIALQGLLFSIIVLGAFFIGKAITNGNTMGGSTLAFMVFSLIECFHAYNMRSNHSLFKIGFFSNKKLNISTSISILLICFVLFVPGVNEAFNMIYLPYYGYLIGIGLSFIPLIFMECSKAFGLIKHQK